MKTMTCKQLGGACDEAFTAATFEEIVELSKTHGMAMFQQQDATHMAAMMEVQKMLQDPAAMMQWFATKKQEFDNQAED
ncbi:DUF1059 domain-containing protein [Vibrio sp. 99-70-13A1]|uniref:DUF1059 domain-containing protein n=1 Tax=Vibrio sp. 99-70-13A1 TaxID=2607601 RepID=UPI0014934CAB|nr:DUF1059 domain-containing protein [Vibrio sp. 99-70-13A1]NOH95833.1 DUF1059 domain-containing protein [Vibrio sp. 99-70-13A1]